jgi:hypothetical protein
MGSAAFKDTDFMHGIHTQIVIFILKEADSGRQSNQRR